MTKKKKTAAGGASGRKKTVRKKDLREEINVLRLIEALESHVLGEKEMTSTQVNAALALLKKILPDMAGPAAKTQELSSLSAHEDALSALE